MMHIKLGIVIIFLTLTSYIFYLRAENSDLQKNISSLQQANEANQRYIQTMKDEFDKINASQMAVSKVLMERDAEIIVLNEKLNKLSRVSAKKPTLVEKRINEGTRKVFENIEKISNE